MNTQLCYTTEQGVWRPRPCRPCINDEACLFVQHSPAQPWCAQVQSGILTGWPRSRPFTPTRTCATWVCLDGDPCFSCPVGGCHSQPLTGSLRSRDTTFSTQQSSPTLDDCVPIGSCSKGGRYCPRQTMASSAHTDTTPGTLR